MNKPPKRGKKIGKSQVELMEVRQHVNVEGEDIGPAQKPHNIYLEGKRKSGGSVNCSRQRPMVRGFGPSKVLYNEKMPKLSGAEMAMLLTIESKTHLTPNGKPIPKINLVAIKMEKMDLITWSERSNGWVTMVEGRRVASRLL